MSRNRVDETSESNAQRPRLLASGVVDDTKSKILEAAFRRLAREGYAALSMREIAKDAGVNHALINYHFRTKDQLVITVLDEANRRLLERQHRMYDAPTTFAEKWREARRFYETDLGSGFVRVQAELWAASMSNAGLREKFVPRLLAWKELVLGGVREAFEALEASGVRLPAPFTAEVVATWITEFWLGMEFADLIGIREEQIAHNAALDAIERLLENLDVLARKRAKSAPAKAGRRVPKRRRT